MRRREGGRDDPYALRGTLRYAFVGLFLPSENTSVTSGSVLIMEHLRAACSVLSESPGGGIGVDVAVLTMRASTSRLIANFKSRMATMRGSADWSKLCIRIC